MVTLEQFPWIEQYRPTIINNLAINDELKKKIELLIKTMNFQNILITGDTGTCKTTSVNCILRELYNNKYDDIMMLNLSSDICKKTTQDNIINFCEKKINNKKIKFKTIVIDNIDKIQERTQQVIINLLKKYNTNIKFILIGTGLHDIIESIQTECLLLHFDRIEISKIKFILEGICKTEKIEYDEMTINEICNSVNGDIRTAINLLQYCYAKDKKCCNNNILNLYGLPDSNTNKLIIQYIMDKNYKELIKIIKKLYKSYSGTDIIHGLYYYLNTENSTLNTKDKIILLKHISIIQFNILKNSESLLQL